MWVGMDVLVDASATPPWYTVPGVNAAKLPWLLLLQILGMVVSGTNLLGELFDKKGELWCIGVHRLCPY